MDETLVCEVLKHLGCPRKAPTLRYLNQLIHSYVRTVPWESVSRIVKRHTTPGTEDCPRLPEEFWKEALRYGLGGTCFESSLAFYELLVALGYEAYLTVNDMGSTRACHAAVVVLLGGRKYLVDVTIPVHAAAHFAPGTITRRHTPFHDYTIRPVRQNAYNIERSHHPNRIAFTLIDVPVGLADYRRIVEHDYTESGYFLKSVVVVKVVGNRAWRFFAEHKPYRLESFGRGIKAAQPLEEGSLAHTLADTFRLPEDRISAALSWTSAPRP